jgi:hypothetical protein
VEQTCALSTETAIKPSTLFLLLLLLLVRSIIHQGAY